MMNTKITSKHFKSTRSSKKPDNLPHAKLGNPQNSIIIQRIVAIVPKIPT
ncbi:hypothetical protein KsCSTR_28660 [Candidatus Kuenenia stuttgartiensis]|uniref:Uncharacterized protein n=1 Tax=Kuenenia stuttgartiensis TaxID=174633 RepID=A0A6G7GRV5_KUEST|nr:hypothetical protein KsCSTR_28660 [Candidatus Kuenenia stuttgartiensis]